MYLFKHPLFIAALVAFVGHQVVQKILNWSLPFVDQFLDPFAGTIVLLTCLLYQWQNWFHRNPSYRFGYLELIGVALSLSFLSEFVFPRISTSFTGDWGDVIGIFLATILFHLTINQKH